MIMMTRLMIVAFAAGASVLGCSSDGLPTGGVTIRDSLGIRIIENEFPAWSSTLPRWTVDSNPSIKIVGDPGSEEYFLHGVRAVQRTGDGLIAVANGGTDQILMFDSLGNFVHAIGGPGEGPGEFSSVFDLHKCAGDTLVVHETIRLSMLDSRGAFVRTELIAGRLAEGRGNLEGVSVDCSSILVIEGRQRPPRPGDGIYQLPSTLYWSALDGSARDTVLSFPGADAYPSDMSGGLYFLRLPFGKEPVWTVSDDHLYYGAADEFEILVIDRFGRTVKIVRWAEERQSITQDDWERHEEGYGWLMQQEPSLRGNYPEPDDFPKPDVMPAYNGLLVDDLGNVWVRQYQFEGWYDRFPTDQVWWVFDRSGRWLGEVETPPGLRVLGVLGGLVAGVAHDAEDVEHVHMCLIRKSEG